MLYLIDANLIRSYAHGDAGSENFERRFLAEGPGNCAFSAVIFYELQTAVYNHRLTDAVRIAVARLSTALKVYDFDLNAATHAARVKSHLVNHQKLKQGKDVDFLLAGHALALGATVATHNVKDFARVPGLAVEDWMQPPA